MTGQICVAPDTASNFLALEPPQNLTGNDGPYYIKIYPYIVRRTDQSGGLELSEVHEAIHEMQSDFKEHNIHFYIACIRYINDTDDYLDAGSALSNHTGPSDGISLLLYDDIIGSGPSGFSGIPSIKLFAYIRNPSDKILSHEMGHALGLYHTFKDTGCGPSYSALNEYVDGTDCEILGDFICDTEATPNLAIVGYNSTLCTYENTTCLDPNDEAYENADPKNIMNYAGPCRQYFTPGQGERMRNTIENHSGHSLIQRNEFYITGIETWSSPFESDVDIVISEGAQLNIETTVEIAPGRRILVEKEGLLFTDEATLTVGEQDSECPSTSSMWAGIFLTCAEEIEQANAVITNGTTIEHALTAFTWYGPTHETTNGRVRAYNSFFTNNFNTVHFYTDFTNKQLILPSMFFSCTIKVDDSYLGDKFNEHIFLVNASNGIILRNTHLKNEMTSTEGYNRGINSFRSRVVAASPSVVAGFDGFTRAVQLFSGPQVNPHSIFTGLTWTDNGTGIQNSASNGLSVRESTFWLRNSGNSHGILQNNATGYFLNDNTFRSTTGHNSNRGIQITNGGVESNVIEGNFFLKVGSALEAFGMNGDIFSGLQWRCNTNTDNISYDLSAIGGSVTLPPVALHQGTPVDPAGNIFSQNITPTGSDFTNSNTYFDIHYSYDENEADQEPLNIVNVIKIGLNDEATCSHLLMDEYTPVGNIVPLVDSLQESLDSLTTLYENELNEVKQLELQSRIIRTDALIDGYANVAINYLLLDTISSYPDYDSLRYWLLEKHSFEADLAVLDSYLEEEDYSSYSSFLATVSSRHSLAPEQEEDLALYERMSDVLIDVWTNDRSESLLIAAEIDSMEVFANYNDRRIARIAKNILEVFYNYDFSDTLSFRSSANQVVEEQEESDSQQWAYPNPATNVVHFAEPNGIQSVDIYTMEGKQIASLNGAGETTIAWNSSKVASGHYVYIITTLVEVTRTGSVILYHE